MTLAVASGLCIMCDIGLPTGEADVAGNPLFTGDLVRLWQDAGDRWEASPNLMPIVKFQYLSYCDGTIEPWPDKAAKPFTMGISSYGISGGPFAIRLEKSHKEAIPGLITRQYMMSYTELES